MTMTRSQQAGAAGRLFLGYGSAAALLAMINKHLSEQVEGSSRLKKVKSYVNARYPVLSIDPDLTDAVQEAELQDIGLTADTSLPVLEPDEEPGIPKTAGRLTELLNDFFNPMAFLSTPEERSQSVGLAPEVLWDRLHRGSYPASQVGLALMAMGAGAYGGWALGNKLANKTLSEKKQREMDRIRNATDQTLYKEFARTRGVELPKTAEGPASAPPVTDPGIVGRAVDVFRHPGDSLHAALTAWMAYAMITGSLAAKGSKAYFDRRDPARRQVATLESIAKRRAVNRTPVMLLSDESSLSGLEKLEKKSKAKQNRLSGGAAQVALPSPDAIKQGNPYDNGIMEGYLSAVTDAQPVSRLPEV